MIFVVQTLARHLSVHAAQNRVAGRVGKLRIIPDGLRARSLHDQHEQTVTCLGALGVGQFHQRSHWRIVDRVKDIADLVRQEVQRTLVFVREHTERGRVEHDLDISGNATTGAGEALSAGQNFYKLIAQRVRLLEIASTDVKRCTFTQTMIGHNCRCTAITEQ